MCVFILLSVVFQSVSHSLSVVSLIVCVTSIVAVVSLPVYHLLCVRLSLVCMLLISKLIIPNPCEARAVGVAKRYS